MNGGCVATPDVAGAGALRLSATSSRGRETSANCRREEAGWKEYARTEAIGSRGREMARERSQVAGVEDWVAFEQPERRAESSYRSRGKYTK